ncbi:MAG TPA: class I SAM-dependent methyltransferase [Geobacteraceae bacterium]
MSGNLKVKEQFDKQAHKFDEWSVTRNTKILDSLYNFFGIESDDRLLDVACGTGAFAIHAAQRTRLVRGVDISEGMIGIAIEEAKKNELDNVDFFRSDVEKLPFDDCMFDSVVSKSAFHHMKNSGTVFGEMKRCCVPGGRICLEDVILYGEKKLDGYFELLECEIDDCHHCSLSRRAMVDLYRGNGIEVTRIFESVSDLNFFDYINHAFQSEDARERVAAMFEAGMQDAEIAKWFVMKDGALYWKRKVLTIVGRKASSQYNLSYGGMR